MGNLEQGEDSAMRQGATTAAVFGEVLRHHREVAGLTQEGLAVKIPCDRSLVARVETGTRVPQERFVLACDRVLGAGDIFSRLWEKIDWYPQVTHPDWFKRRVEMEAKAVELQTYQIDVVPGLLQTEEYMRALFSQFFSGREMEERVAARMSRKQHFLKPDSPLLVVVLDESTIRNVVGNEAVMRDQCEELLLAGERQNMRIQVAPFAKPLIRPKGSMSLITLPDGQDWLYSESLEAGHFINDPAITARYTKLYDVLRADCLSGSDSAALIRDVMEGYGRDGNVAQKQLQRERRRRLHRNSPRYPRLRPRKGQ
ncbi:helix-turn-helix domain-containing protein [Streptomyces abikoensis]|uniref:helix-turn-helix domain-containing protein n=1 Tax=Streptomyces abikoensis TaxID=97398 RepID=UPI00198A5178|nr:helix-turn-helix transcriptional regulator [Streptomyces abikoensis]GGP54839.1 transcriptional regulator [Streptomyces abikoensis]